MGFGLGVLRLPPETFWRMTLRELVCAMEGVAGLSQQPPGRAALEQLMRRFPDR